MLLYPNSDVSTSFCISSVLSNRIVKNMHMPTVCTGVYISIHTLRTLEDTHALLQQTELLAGVLNE